MSIDLPDDWLAAAEALRGRQRIAVLGPNGAGKSTFCHWLADGLAAQLLDADVGQQSLGPPATVALRSGTATQLHFIGSTNPLGNTVALRAGVAALVAVAGSAPLVVNTSGLIAGPGVGFKLAKLGVLRPDAVVAIQPAAEVEPLLEALRHLPILRLRPSRLARRRSTAQRRAARQAAFARHFAGAAEFTWQERAIALYPPSAEPIPDLLCGLGGADGSCLGLGVLRAWRDGRLCVITAVPREAVRRLQFGRMLVTPDGVEHGLLHVQKAPRLNRGA